MSALQSYELTDEELAELVELSGRIHRARVISIARVPDGRGGVRHITPATASRELLHRLWERVAERVGCRTSTISPADQSRPKHFRAVAL